ncbi:GFA family protein [Phenylobacterium sp.]|uniref:GFA family protein n=1 Tax=Phenylobacterium sp. TaxID=1871053 RepID=UPI003BA9B819
MATAKSPRGVARGRCACGAVEVEIGVPARWAWHDHSQASRLAQGCAYATYVGSWRSRFRVVEGEAHISRYEDEVEGTVRSFCTRCGTPLFYERRRSPQMVNVPRALFTTRTGREPRYHMHLSQQADWTYQGEPLAPLKGYPGVMWEKPGRKRKPPAPMF